ncbi:hypothetical protein [Aeromonas veronii]
MGQSLLISEEILDNCSVGISGEINVCYWVQKRCWDRKCNITHEFHIAVDGMNALRNFDSQTQAQSKNYCGL